MAFLSVAFDTVSLVLVSLSRTYQHVLGCKSTPPARADAPAFAVLALGSGDNPTYKSVFVSAVPPEDAGAYGTEECVS